MAGPDKGSGGGGEFQRLLRRALRQVLREERLRPYRELAAMLRQYADDLWPDQAELGEDA
jgi:hypothetical protein